MFNLTLFASRSDPHNARRDESRLQAKLPLKDRDRDSNAVGTQYMLIAMSIVEIGGLVYLALVA